MTDKDTTDAEEKASEEVPAFSPDALSPEAKEYIRRTVQSESDRKAALQTQAELRKFQAAQADAMRKNSEQADQTELTRLATEQNYEEIGRRVAGRLSTQGIKEAAVLETAEIIERQLVEQFSKTLGAEAVEEIRAQVASTGGAHAEFAVALAAATAGKTRAEEIQAEIKAALIEAGVVKREETAGASVAAKGGTGAKTSTFEEIETAYGRGEVSEETYLAAKAARKTGV